MESEIEAMLQDQPYAFSFFQAVRLLERLHSDRKPVGHFVPPASEIVRFGVSSSLAFPASEIQSFVPGDGGPSRMTVNFMGLTGPLGMLPLYYTELIDARIRDGDTALKDFLDIFNHRMISLFYRAWEKYRLAAGFEKEGSEGDYFSRHLLALIGLGTPGLRNRQSIPDDAFIYYAGLLMGHSRSVTVLKQLIADFFEVEVEVQEFAGSWYRLDSHMQTQLDEAMGDSGKLGMGAIVGDEVWQDESTVRIKLGPLSLEAYLEFMPGRPAYESLQAWTRFFSGDEVNFELQLVLKRGDVPGCQLGAEGAVAPRLGWVTWVKSLPFGHEAADTILQL
jgi:type VI secretion system protein ImpH